MILVSLGMALIFTSDVISADNVTQCHKTFLIQFRLLFQRFNEFFKYLWKLPNFGQIMALLHSFFSLFFLTNYRNSIHLKLFQVGDSVQFLLASRSQVVFPSCNKNLIIKFGLQVWGKPRLLVTISLGRWYKCVNNFYFDNTSLKII